MSGSLVDALDAIVYEARSAPYTGDTRAMPVLCRKLITHSELASATDAALISIAGAAGYLSVEATPEQSPLSASFKGRSLAIWTFARLFSLYDVTRIAGLLGQLRQAFESRRYGELINEGGQSTRLFLDFVETLVEARSRSDKTRWFVDKSILECEKGSEEWIFAALQIVSIDNQASNAKRIDALYAAYVRLTGRAEAADAEDEKGRFLGGYFHPAHFKQRVALLGVEPEDPTALAPIAQKLWLVENRFGATFLYPPGWFWLEFWRFAPWEVLRTLAEQSANQTQFELVDRGDLQAWLAKSWAGWREVDFGRDIKAALLSPFLSPDKFRF